MQSEFACKDVKILVQCDAWTVWSAGVKDRKQFTKAVLNLGTTEGLKELCVAINHIQCRECIFSHGIGWDFCWKPSLLDFLMPTSATFFQRILTLFPTLQRAWLAGGAFFCCVQFFKRLNMKMVVFGCEAFCVMFSTLWYARFLASLGANVIFQTWKARGCNLRESVQTCLVIMVFQG